MELVSFFAIIAFIALRIWRISRRKKRWDDITGRTAIKEAEAAAEELLKQKAIKEWADIPFSEEISEEKAKLYCKYISVNDLFTKITKYPAACLYNGEISKLDFNYNTESLCIAQNICISITAYTDIHDIESCYVSHYKNFYEEMCLYYFILCINIIKRDNRNTDSYTSSLSAYKIFASKLRYTPKNISLFHDANICKKIADMCSVEILPEIFQDFAKEVNGTCLKNTMIKSFAVYKPENVNVILNSLDDEFQKGLYESVQTNKDAIKEIILKKTLCGYEVPQKSIRKAVKENNVLLCGDTNVIFTYYTQHFNGNTSYNNFCFNCNFDKLPNGTDIKVDISDKFQIYKLSGSKCVINYRADIDFNNLDSSAEMLELASHYQNIIVSAPKEFLDNNSMAFDDFISTLIINHKKSDSKNKSMQNITVLTDGQLDVNTMAKIEGNLKNYKILKDGDA